MIHIINTHQEHEGDHAMDSAIDVALRDPLLAKPPMYAIIMHNDDYTTMEFVVAVLMGELNHSPDDAYDLMLQIHHQGLAKVATLPKEIAETKVQRITTLAESYEFPLLVTMEPDKLT